MHPNAIHGRLAAELKEVEARLVARLDALEAKIDRLLSAAGLAAGPDGGKKGGDHAD